jgi:hypothetical protein
MEPTDPELRKFATARQIEIIDTLDAVGGDITKAAAKLGMKSTGSITNAIAGLKRRAARYGHAPENDMTKTVPDGFLVKGVSTYYDQEGEVRGRWVKSTIDQERQAEIVREMVAEMAETLPRVKSRPADKQYNDQLMSVIPFGDPHFGMYAWADEVGNDFDLDIAKRDLCAAVSYLVSKSPTAKRCVIVNLGDFFHADNTEGKTAKHGNILDMDTRLPKVIRVGVSAMRKCIETALERHETVEVVNAIGNHDEVLSMAMSIMLANVYENEPRVIVHDAPTRRHYVRHGKVLIGVTHGDRTKDSQLPGIMATERAEDWGQSRHRYFYRGHHHHDSREEFNGCIVEQFRTLAPGDAYAVGGGYLAGRDMKLIVHHSEYGECERVTCSIDMLRSVA